MDWCHPRAGRICYSAERFVLAQAFFLRMWVEWAAERGAPVPADLSGSCKYGSLFICRVFGGAINGHYQHQYNRIEGLRLDMSADAADVAAMHEAYLHEPGYFQIPEVGRMLDRCLPRVDAWVELFLGEVSAAGAAAPGPPGPPEPPEAARVPP